MRKAFNTLGNIELVENTMKYRISVQDLGVDNPLVLEKDLKRKLLEIENQNNYLVPYSIEVVNRYMILYYDVAHYKHLDYLQELDLEEKLPFLLSLVQIAKSQEKGFNVVWDKANFVLDHHEQRVKVMLFETELLKVYEVPNDILKTVQDMICASMTNLKSFVSLPRRQDFIDASEENIRFIEDVYRMESIDDLNMYLETQIVDLEQSYADSIEEEVQKKTVKRTLFKKSVATNRSEVKAKRKKNVPKKSVPNGAARKKDNGQRNFKLMVGAVIGVFALYFLSSMMLPSAEEVDNDGLVPVASVDDDGYFTGSATNNVHLVEAYRTAYNSDYKASYESLNQMDFKELDVKDVPLLIQSYEETGNLHQLLDKVPSVANEVVTYLLTKNKLEQLSDITAKMETQNPYIEFEKAHYNQEYEYMLSLVEAVDINGRKESQIIDAYLALEMPEDARRFAEKMGNPDLIKRVEEYRE